MSFEIQGDPGSRERKAIASMASISKNKEGVPSWNGEPSLWGEYRSAARLFVASTKYELRYTCGPKLASELTGSAKTAVMGQKSSWLSDPQGAERLLKHLQKVIGEPALPEVGNFMRQYFKVLRRKQGETMSSFCVRHRDEYEKMCRALGRIVKEHGKAPTKATPGTSTTSTPAPEAAVPSVAGSNSGDGAEGPTEAPAAEQPGEPQWRAGWNSWYGQPWHQGWYGGTNWWGGSYHWDAAKSYGDYYGKANNNQNEDEEDDDFIQVLPDAVQVVPSGEVWLGSPGTVRDPRGPPFELHP